MNAIDLNGQVAVVTGGAQGIGLAVAKRLIASGAKVSLWDRSAADLDAAIAAIGPAGSAITVDITDFPALQAATAQVEAELGSLDIVVNSAGVATGQEWCAHRWRAHRLIQPAGSA